MAVECFMGSNSRFSKVFWRQISEEFSYVACMWHAFTDSGMLENHAAANKKAHWNGLSSLTNTETDILIGGYALGWCRKTMEK